MKARNIIGATMLIVGMFIAVCTADGCKAEIVMRAIGVALVATGGFVGGYFSAPCDNNDEEGGEQ